MKQAVSIIFPYQLQLTILQLEGYHIGRFLRWVSRHFFTRKLESKRQLETTFKVVLIHVVFGLISVTVFGVGIVSLGLTPTILLLFILWSQPWLMFSLAVLIMYPFQSWEKARRIAYTKHKLRSLPNLTIVGITGSYGKSSVKEMLFHILRSKYQVLRTPHSFNTVLGIAKVVEYELDNSYDIFLCEMGAYQVGDIAKICTVVQPSWGVLTGIAPQHLERFGSLERIVKTKFELVDSIHDTKQLVVNINNTQIQTEIKYRNLSKLIRYGIKHTAQLGQADSPKDRRCDNDAFFVQDIRFSKDRTTFSIFYENKKYSYETSIFGLANMQNIAGVIAFSKTFGIPMKTIQKRIKSLKQNPHRFERRYDATTDTTIVDNTFSSNLESVRQLVATTQLVEGNKVLVTPGLVEFPRSTRKQVHQQIGELITDQFEHIVLVGNNNRTQAIASGLKQHSYQYIDDTRKAYFETIRQLQSEYNWIFLENDVTQNY